MAGFDGAKKFYEQAEVTRQSDGFSVALDGRGIKTPAGSDFALPTERLAEIVADEWNAQSDNIDAATTPMFRLAATVIDRVRPNRAEVVEITLKFGETDLLCYRAEAPPDLAWRQAEAWQPWLDWAARDLGAELAVTTGIQPVKQPAAALEALGAAVGALDDYQLMGVSAATAAAGSLILALALGQGAMAQESCAEAALFDDHYQIERWGDDDEAGEHRRRVQGEIEEAARFIELCR